MRQTIRILITGAALMVCGMADGQLALATPSASPEADAAEQAELLLLDELRRRAGAPKPDPADFADDTISVVGDDRSAVVCHWRRRNGSNFRERRCRTRSQASREEQQAEHAMRRLRGF